MRGNSNWAMGIKEGTGSYMHLMNRSILPLRLIKNKIKGAVLNHLLLMFTRSPPLCHVLITWTLELFTAEFTSPLCRCNVVSS